ncbi:ABC transporter ATP-binding protein [Rhabdaerophilum calidifontis]|uniref:ABC transporter ATP-binding protein n=1 Tax=Rhabdaerophilum calidifontis TaxID=2604328 RepID=UPI001239F3EB|nr:ABC transporter ATP-binding protein [Rhabdaerophilum calidifontis]
MSSSRAASVEFRNVWKRWGEAVAVRDVSFRIEAGTLTTLLGPSGCGKTTTLRLVAGLEIASAGQVLIGGEDVTRRGAAERDVSMVFQSYALFPHMNVLENCMYGPRAAGVPRARAEAMAREKLALVGLAGLENRLPSELSGGQQQRVAVARAIVLEPRVLLFDEPLSNLDARLRRVVRDEIRELQKRLGLTVLYVTHDQQEALAVSDRVIVMDRAVIAQEGAPQELYHRPASRFLADFIGEANLIDGAFRTAGGEVLFEREGVVLALGALALPPEARCLAIRPDRIALRAAAGGAACRVARVAFVGPSHEYVLTAPWGEVLVVRPSSEPVLSPGSAVELVPDPGAAIPLA